MNGINYEDLELRALAHMAYQCGPRMKSVSVDREAVRELSRRHAWAYDNSPRVKPRQAAHTEGIFDQVALGLAAARSFGLRHAEVAADLQRLANTQPWDPAPPLRMGPQRCLSSRETIERLAFVLPKPTPALTPKEIGEYLSAWWSKYPAAREYFPERTKPRTVWLGGDYIDDGRHKATPEEAAERWREVREALVSIEREGARRPT